MRHLFCVLLLCVVASWACAQPLFDYVAAPDESYTWEKAGETKAETGGSVISLNMTSQTWQGITWEHRIAIAVPAKVRHPETCLLVITGGNPQGDMFVIANMISSMLGMPIAVLGDIPNQPLFDGLTEDAAISYTFAKYLETGDTTWPLLYPMTKSAVRAMDAIQELSAEEWDKKVEGFIITGGSKRGWTTWFTGEVDKRVKSIAPLVYDNLNLPAQMKHHIAQWGSYSVMIDDYTKRGLPDMLATEQGRKLSELVDPYTYRDRAKMPKLIVTGTNDPYWPLDAANDYFDDLVGPKYILYVPNSGHGLDDRARALGGLAGFAAATVGDIPFPKFTWKFEETDEGLSLAASSEQEPSSVLLWTASASTKDFRQSKWESAELEATDGRYCHLEPAPAEGYRAFFFELRYGEGMRALPLSTNVRIIGAE